MSSHIEAFLDAADSKSSDRNEKETQRFENDSTDNEEAPPAEVLRLEFESRDGQIVLSSGRTSARGNEPGETRTETRMPSEATRPQDVRRSQRTDDNGWRLEIERIEPASLDMTVSFDQRDRQVAALMNRYGYLTLRYSLGVVFIWFGGLKIVGISPASELVANTVYWFPPDLFIPFLGVWETAIGVCLLFRPLIRLAILLLLLQMPGTMLPMVLLPNTVFTEFPIGLSLEGQYIVKNLVLVSAALVLGGTVRDRTPESGEK